MAEVVFIVVDNDSSDNSVKVAHKLELPVIWYVRDRGYGGSNMTAFDYTKRRETDILVVLHFECQ